MSSNKFCLKSPAAKDALLQPFKPTAASSPSGAVVKLAALSSSLEALFVSLNRIVFWCLFAGLRDTSVPFGRLSEGCERSWWKAWKICYPSMCGVDQWSVTQSNIRTIILQPCPELTIAKGFHPTGQIQSREAWSSPPARLARGCPWRQLPMLI